MNKNLVEECEITYYRCLNRVIRNLRGRQVGQRISSWPFLACDTYAGESSFILNKDRNLASHLLTLKQRLPLRSCYASRKNVAWLLEVLEKSGRMKYANYLILGDSDESIESADLMPFKNYFDYILSTNLTSENPKLGIFGLPIGLENKSYLSSGLLNSYKKTPSFDVADRKFGILVSWNDETFSPYRSKVKLKLLSHENAKVLSRRVPFQLIHRLTKASLMVACPRGNGFDTHRIWESLYLGALPVMTKTDFLPVFTRWPIFVVDSWESLAAMNRNELERIYCSYTSSLVSFRASAKDFMEGIFHD